MGYYSDPTAAQALGNINREFSKLEKKAEKLCKKLKAGEISPETFNKAHSQFKGLYQHVLTHALEKQEKEET